MNAHYTITDPVETDRQIEDKAKQCLKLAQAILPGTDEYTIEDQAIDFMPLPSSAVVRTLQRMSSVKHKSKKKSRNSKQDTNY